jgi:hypothetical protein
MKVRAAPHIDWGQPFVLNENQASPPSRICECATDLGVRKIALGLVASTGHEMREGYQAPISLAQVNGFASCLCVLDAAELRNYIRGAWATPDAKRGNEGKVGVFGLELARVPSPILSFNIE